MQLPQLTKSQFKTFFLLYAAHIDYDYSSPEEEFIRKRSSLADYNSMYTLLNNHSEYNSLKIILDNKCHYLENTKEKDDLYKEVIDLFKIDGQYSRPEKVFLDFLDKMMLTT
jgi:hypothetical protein